jgi:hypothetical protein
MTHLLTITSAIAPGSGIASGVAFAPSLAAAVPAPALVPGLLPALVTAAAAVPAFLRLPCTVRRRSSGMSPPSPWRPHPWHRWLPWWWFR